MWQLLDLNDVSFFIFRYKVYDERSPEISNLKLTVTNIRSNYIYFDTLKDVFGNYFKITKIILKYDFNPSKSILMTWNCISKCIIKY